MRVEVARWLITMVYDHYKQHVEAVLTDIQHDYHVRRYFNTGCALGSQQLLGGAMVRDHASLVKKRR